MERQTRAYVYACAAILCWATVASAFKLTLRYLSFTELLFYSSCVSLVVLGGFTVIGGMATELCRWSRGDYLRSAVLGFLNPFLYYLILFKAYHLLPAQEAQPLNFSWPIVLVLLSIVLLKQPIHLGSLLAMLVSFAGVLTISTRGDVVGWQVTDGLGVALALGSTVIWSLYWIYGIKDQRDPVLRLFVNFAFGLGFVTLYLLLMEEPRVPPWQGLAGACYVGLFEMGITFVFWLKALRMSRTTIQVTRLIFLSPFLSLIVIHLVVGEPIYPSTVVGLVLIVAGILLQQYGEQRRWRRSARTLPAE
jgi:drug/metabolite transporter (DMT)-like permease